VAKTWLDFLGPRMTLGPSICARRRKGVARNRVPVVVRHGL